MSGSTSDQIDQVLYSLVHSPRPNAVPGDTDKTSEFDDIIQKNPRWKVSVSHKVSRVEEAMGADNSGVVYALWSYQGQAADELGFNEGDMVTILQKAQGVNWWWASLCGREGFVPNNYFGV
ncbi:unnamed protein product [Arctogadus glacialis]